MATSIVKHEYNGFPVRQRITDEYVCLTDMAKVEGRRVGDFLDLPRTQEFVEALAVDLQQLPENLVVKKEGRNGGTYGHPVIAMKMAQWVSIPFEIWANRTLVEVVKERTEAPKTELPPADVRVTNLLGALDRLGVDLTNPRFNQELQDFALDLVLGKNRLPESSQVWAGVAEVAEEMGYAISLVTKHRSNLGKFVASFELCRKKEKRLCNGTQREINLYLDCQELREAIAEFMDAKVLADSLKNS